MNCASCGHANPERAKFCLECGAAIAARCARCATDLPPGAKFCLECGAPTASPSADSAGRRKVVTIVFADLVGSTALHERLDAESASRFMESYYRAMRGAVEAHGGTVTQLLGDGVKAVFGVPRVAEDDAIRAVRAGVEMQARFRELAEQQSGRVGTTGLRVAVNTGEVVATDETEIIGDPVNVAARLQEQGRDGDVVLGESTQRLVSALVTLEPLGSFALKGRSEAVKAYRVVSLDRPAGAAAVAFVGRDEELARISAVYRTAVEKPAACLSVLLGSPGLGKSRLIDEFARRLGDGATVFSAHCDAAGGASFAPLAAALRQGLGIEAGASGDALSAAVEASLPGGDAERARIAAGIASLLAGSPGSPEEAFFVVRRLLGALAASKPVVLVIDDLHWAEPLLLDLVEHLVQWGSGVPLLVLVSARPELRDVRSSLTMPGGFVADAMTLAGLDAGAAMRLAANVIGASDLPAAVAGRVLAASEGNPLFVGELVRMLVHEGALQREGDRWITGKALAALEMPPTIQALLAARIERLRPEERTVLERAAVVGRQFSRTAVAQLLPREIGDLDARLEALRRHELIESDTGWLLGEPVLRFHHVLIRDAAYRRVLKETRADLHARLAEWIEGRAGEATEQDETIGWHLEQAHVCLRELGPIDERGRTLGERASRRLAAAGRRALARDDVPLAAGLLGRALDRLDPADPERGDLALDWCEALLSAGEVGAASGAIDELGRFVASSARLRAWHTCFTGELAALTNPQALRETADAVAAAAGELAVAGDAAGEAKAHAVHALALSRLGRVGASEAALDRALAAARRVDDRRRANAVLAGAPLAALWGPSPVTRASGRCLDVVRVLRITQGAPAVEAVALRCQGVLEALRGRADAARRMIASSRRMVEELGLTQGLLETEVSAGLVELIEGDFEAAERSLRTAYEGLRAHGLGIDAARAAGLLGRTLLPQDRAAEAESLSHESEALAGDDLQAAITWRRVRAEALARRGEHASALEFARAAVDIAAATDNLLHHADARLGLAVALRAAGRAAEADAEEARAVELWQAKGATLLAERVRVGAAPTVAPVKADEVTDAPRRLVRANAATANRARFDAAVADRDVDALAGLFAADIQSFSHRLVSGSEDQDREGVLANWLALLAAEAPICRHQPLATLSDSLLLCRQSVSARGFAGRTFDVGAYEREAFAVIEVDADGRRRRFESFEVDKLGDAVVRLYERYAEILPGGRERDRAAAISRSVAALMGPPERWPFAPDLEGTDHRTVGWGSLHGAEAVVRSIRTLIELSGDFESHIDDVLALRSEALLLRWTTTGTVRASGGSYERALVVLWIFGTDGQITAMEQFDAEQEGEALVRFIKLTAGARPVRPRRRVRANAALAHVRAYEAAVGSRAVDAFERMIAENATSVNHATGAELNRAQMLRNWRSFLASEGFTLSIEPLATLGEALVLSRVSTSARGVARGNVDVGAYDNEEIVLVEVDAEGRHRRIESFPLRSSGDAIVRLYERYADLLPTGAERERAAATAQSVAALMGPPDRWPLAADVEATDHRTVGFGSLRGADAVARAIRALSDLADEWTVRVDEVLDLRPDALLLRWITSGTLRESGGAFERLGHLFWIFGPDGRITRWEQFDVEHEAEALARFEALTGGAPLARRVRPNAATASEDFLASAIAARDLDAIAAHGAELGEVLDHRVGAIYDRQGWVAMWGSLLRARGGTYRQEPLASLGDSLALCHQRVTASGAAGERFDVGAYEMEWFIVAEVDGRGRPRRREAFATDKLGDAVARLYSRYAELLPEGPERARAARGARSVETMLGPPDVERDREALSPTVEVFDRRTLGYGSARGAKIIHRATLAQLELETDFGGRVDEIFDLRPDAFLVRKTNSGTDRRTGGAYERSFLLLIVLGADGRVSRWEQFDGDRDDEALARFDELTEERPAPRRVERRVRPNTATAGAERANAAITSRDAEALALLHGDVQVTDHALGYVMNRTETLAWWELFFADPDAAFRLEPIASLGSSLALCRRSWTGSASDDGRFETGPFENESLDLIEDDPGGRLLRVDTFARDRLGDAIVRLYERYAELLPEGAERARAAAIARSAATLPLNQSVVTPVDRFPLAPDVEFIDHRIVGVGPVHGAEAVIRTFRALRQLTSSWAVRVEDVLRLRSDAFLVRWTNHGTLRDGGGAYERQLLQLYVFGDDGLVARQEQFDAEQQAEALARFDALEAAKPAPPPVRRRVRPNAATAHTARLDVALAARDTDLLLGLFGDDTEAIDHVNLTRWDAHTVRSSWRSLALAEDPSCRHEPLATLGENLALCRVSLSARRLARGSFDVGGYEKTELHLIEVDAQGRRRSTEVFAVEKLGGAVTRLYERYAELLPEGPERVRAAATARSVASATGPLDPERSAAGLSRDVELIDRRTLGTFSARGREALLQGLRTWQDVAEHDSVSMRELLGLRRDALLARMEYAGTDRAGGGRFERPTITLVTYGAAGHVASLELFDAEHDAEALARFDALEAAPVAPRFANAAWRFFERSHECHRARDWDGFRACHAPSCEIHDRRPHVQLRLSVEEVITGEPILAAAPGIELRSTLLATRGERLALARSALGGETPEFGTVEFDLLSVAEVDAEGRAVAVVVFALDALDAAYAELDARYEAGEGAAFPRVAAALRARSRAFASRDWDARAALFGPDYVDHDHRVLGFGVTRGGKAYDELMRSLVELAPDVRFRAHHVRRTDRGQLTETTGLGTRDGGAFETPRIAVTELDEAGGFKRQDSYDPEQFDLALARFAELRSAASRPFANAATQAWEEQIAAWMARDHARSAGLTPERFRYVDRRRLFLLDLDRSEYLEFIRSLGDLGTTRIDVQVLGTRGDRLALCQERVSVSGADVGPSEIESLFLTETNERGEVDRFVRFDADDVDAAYAELDARYEAGEGAAFPRVAAAVRARYRAFGRRDWEAFAALCEPEFVYRDHRPLGLSEARGGEAYAELMRSLLELAPDASFREHHVRRSDRGQLAQVTRTGTRDGGAFETPFVRVTELDERGRITRIDTYDPEQLDQALARFAEIGSRVAPDPLRVPENAASRAWDRLDACAEAGDWEAVRTLCATVVFEDRRPLFRTTGDCEMFLANVRIIFESGARPHNTELASLGDRLALRHRIWRLAEDGQASEVEVIDLLEVDPLGRFVAIISFSTDDRAAASAELFERWARSGASGSPAALLEFMRAWSDHDLDRMRAVLPEDFFFHDHRRTGIGRIESRDAYLASIEALFELSRDVRLDPLYEIRVAPHGRVDVLRWFGTNGEGGDFEAVFIRLSLYRGERLVGIEMFELDDLDRALARFAELAPAIAT